MVPEENEKDVSEPANKVVALFAADYKVTDNHAHEKAEEPSRRDKPCPN